MKKKLSTVTEQNARNALAVLMGREQNAERCAAHNILGDYIDQQRHKPGELHTKGESL